MNDRIEYKRIGVLLMLRKSSFILSTLIVYILYVFMKYVSYNDQVLDIVNYYFLGTVLIILSLLFYIIAVVYVIYVIKNRNQITLADLKNTSIQFLILGIFDFFTYCDFSAFLNNSQCLRCIAIILIINCIIGIQKKINKV